MERDELLRATAKRYAEAQLKLELADRDASLAKTQAENARLERDRIEKELMGFVGRNQPRRIVVIPDSTRAVLVQMDLAREEQPVYVSLEHAV